jgi:hypothetical protein
MRNSGSAVNNLHSAFDSEISSADNNIEQPSFKEEDVSKAVKQLHAGKAAAEYGIVAEHLKMAGGVIIPYATKIFN